MGCHVQKTLPVALKVCTEDFAVDAPSSFRVVQVRIKVSVSCAHILSQSVGQRALRRCWSK